MPFGPLSEILWGDLINKVIIPVAGATGVTITLALIYFFRDKIKKWFWRKYKIEPVYEPMMSAYEQEILPEYIEVKPRIEVQLKKEDLPVEHPFGYIFVPTVDVERGIDILLACIPVSSSLKSIRILFDEKLRKSLFSYLSYRLGLETGFEDRAVRFRDIAMSQYPEEYEVIEKLYEEGKLTGIILIEAAIRFRKAKGKPSVSDVREFSRLVRKLVDIDVTVMRIGESSVDYYVERALGSKCGVVLLARGHFIEKAVEVADQLCEKGFELFTPDELGFPNPEIGKWHFVYPKERNVPLQRIWLKRV
jgi:hypothetical protein